jgi:uncharacterized protein (UPF0332 family)
MSVLPRDLLGEARKAAERSDQEPARRTAISRAYYAAYHGAKRYHDLLPLPGRSKANVGDHENLIHQLQHPDPKLTDEIQVCSKVVGGLLLRLRPLRILADYELKTEVVLQAMNDAIEMAAQILNRVDPK